MPSKLSTFPGDIGTTTFLSVMANDSVPFPMLFFPSFFSNLPFLFVVDHEDHLLAFYHMVITLLISILLYLYYNSAVRHRSDVSKRN